jgi:hypothetical protein
LAFVDGVQTVSDHSQLQLESLRRIPFISNWPVEALQSNDCLLLNYGNHIDEIVTDLARSLSTEVIPVGGKVGIASEYDAVPGSFWAIRVIHKAAGSHSSKTDVICTRRNDNLYVRYDVGGFSLTRYLQRALKTTFMLTSMLVVLYAYTHHTNAVAGVLREYARRYSAAPDEYSVAIGKGWRFDPERSRWVSAPLPTLAQLVRNDPQLAFTGFVLPLGVMVAAIGALTYWLPNEAFNIPCRLLGWPAPKSIDAFIRANVGEVRAVVNQTLFERWRVTRASEQSI